MDFVLDASIAGCWAFEGEDASLGTAALKRLASGNAHVPSLWWFELRNLLIVNERRGRIAEQDTAAFLNFIGRLPITLDNRPDGIALLALARRHRLTVYDAAYLELAIREDLSLATLDASLARAARAERVGLVE